MAWRNVFDLGAVDLYWIDGADELRPIGELPSGSITVVNGVIQIRNVPANDSGLPDPNVVKGVAVVPSFSATGQPARVSATNAAIVREGSSPEAGGGVSPATLETGDWDAQTDPITSEGVIVAFDPPQFEIGVMLAAPDALAFFSYHELFG